MAKKTKIEIGVNYFGGEGIQAHGALEPLYQLLYEVTGGTYTNVQVREELPYEVTKAGRRERHRDAYYGETDSEGIAKLKEKFLSLETSNYDVFLNIEA